ncbi:MAG: TonB-dependent receptor [Acidobacteria bacterium]|nr:TonB-dependent receptor [Acidobacteriota bacterium]MCW5950200.1 TonB-dependent receptor [Pyrinomonadaceae bacterium]
MRSRYLFLLKTIIASLLAAGSLFAQSGATVSGTVADANGATLPGASVKVTSLRTGIERSVTTNSSGGYTIAQLQPGIYKLTVTLEGFRMTQIDSVELGVDQNRVFDVTLQLGEVSAVVNVTSDEFAAASIDAGSNRLGVNITAREVQEMPVNGRNYSQLYLNAPGATNVGSGNFNELRFNGRANQQNQTKLDGIEATAIFDASPGYVTVQGSQFRLQTSIENIQEFRVESSNYPAEFGTGTGGQISVIGKSGGNNFSGSLFEYVRNDRFDARNFFDGADKSKLRLNQFGGSLGGPIIKKRLFFFGSYEGLRQRAGFNVIESTPSNFVRDFIAFYDGEGGNTTGVAARTALGISAADATAALTRIQALRATGIVNTFPVGTGTAFNVGGLNNSAQVIQANRTATLDEDAFSFRMDYRFSDRITMYGRYQLNRGKLQSPDGASGRFILAKQRPDNFVFTVNQVYGTSMVNETKFGFNRAPTDLSTRVPSITGLSGFDLSLSSLRLSGNIVSPGINGGAATGFTEPGGLTRQSSAGNGRSQPIRPTSLTFSDTLTWTKGNHTMKFGGEYRNIQVNFDQLGGITYSYGSLLDFVLNRNLTAAFIGDLSQPGNFSIATDPITTVQRSQSGYSRGRQYYMIGFAQDEWKVTPEFTLSYGLRYEYYSVNREKDNRAVVFNPKVGRLVDPSTDFFKAAKNNFGPRLGVTWAPKALGGKTVFRAGGGLFYGPGQYEDLIQPIESNVFRSSTSLANGLTTGTQAAVSSIGGVLQRFTPRAYDTEGYIVPERVLQYGASVQHQLPGNTVLTVGYVGSQGRNLFLRSVTNRILPGSAMIQNGTALPTGVGIINRCSVAPVNGACPGQIVGVTTVREFDIVGRRLDTTTNTIVTDPTAVLGPFGEIDYKTSGGRDRYDALQIQINRRFTSGFTLNGQYQLGKSFGNTQGSNEASTAQNPYSFAEEFGPNTFDIRHSVNVTALYELPIGKGKRFNLTGVADTVFGGWQVGAVYNGRSGTPINVLIVRPDVVAVCQQAAGCTVGTSTVAQGFVITLPSGALPAGFVGALNTPGGNASRSTRRPNRVAGVDPYLTLSNGLRYLNPAAFAMPAPGTYGDLERNALKGPSFHQFDLTFQKRFRLNERANIELRSEIFNVFNRANFSNPPSTLPSNLSSSATSQQPGVPYTLTNVGQFGVINGTVGRTVGLGTNRQIQFAARFNF